MSGPGPSAPSEATVCRRRSERVRPVRRGRRLRCAVAAV